MIVKIEKISSGYDVLHRKTVQAIKDPVALGIWVYLMSLPENWEVSYEQIKKHFGIGEQKRLKAFAELRRLGLYEVARIKGEKGRFTENRIVVYPELREVVATETHSDIYKEYDTKTKTDKNKEYDTPSLSPPQRKKSDEKETAKPKPPQPSYPEALQEWIDYRKEIRKPLKQRTIGKLLKDYETDPETFRQKVEFSITSGYQGLFAPKGGGGGGRGKPTIGSLDWEFEQMMKQRMQAEESIVDTEVFDG